MKGRGVGLVFFLTAIAAAAEPDRGEWIRAAAEQAGCAEELIVGPFFTVEEAARRKASVGQPGVGLALSCAGGVCRIRHVYRGSPAAAAGLRRGTVIVSIDDQATADMSENLPPFFLCGPADSVVVLGIRGADDAMHKVELKRGFTLQDARRNQIEMIAAAGEGEPAVGVIRLAWFDEKQGEDFVRRGMYDLHARGAIGLVLDLRDCAGGHLGAMIDIAGLFLPVGAALFKQGLTAEKAEEISAKAGILCDTKIALVALCGEGTEGPAELLIAALQEHKRAVVLGRRTPGSIVRKQAVTLPDGRVAYRLLGRYYTSGGRLITEEGVAPDQMLAESLTDDEELAIAVAALRARCRAAKQ